MHDFGPINKSRQLVTGMRTSTVVLMALVASAIGFFAGRASVPDPAPPIAEPPQATTSNLPVPAFGAPDGMAPTDARTRLLRALRQPAAERNRAVRLAMNAWLAADGAAALAAVRDDPEFADIAERMMQLALYAYPQLFLDDPSLLEGIPNAQELIATAARAIASFDPDIARSLINRHLSGSTHRRDAILATIDQIEQRSGQPQAAEDPYVELESILAERSLMERIPRLHQLVSRVAANDPAAAARLIDDLPGSLTRHAIWPLIAAWSETNPEEAASWLANKGAQVAQGGFSHLAQQWGRRDFDAASAFADALTGAQRTAFLTGLANAASRMSNDEMLAWMAGYENDPAYPNMVSNAAGSLAPEDIRAAMRLIEGLPEDARPASYSSIFMGLTMLDPQEAIMMIDELENEPMRRDLLPLVSSMWAQDDSQSALDWALDLERGPERDQVIASIAQSLLSSDMDRAIDAIDEIDTPHLRSLTAQQLLAMVESDEEAIRLGRDYDFDRDAVLKLREAWATEYPSSSFYGGTSAFLFNPQPMIIDEMAFIGEDAHTVEILLDAQPVIVDGEPE